jgi:hypothetical protein
LEQLCPLPSHEESRSNTTLTGSPRTANTMNEVSGYLRKVIGNDACDVLHVNAAGSLCSAKIQWDDIESLI